MIDLGQKEIHIKEPFLTVAGQTAPSPGITFIRGGFQVGAHDVIWQHTRVRVGEAGAAKKSGWETDGLSTEGGAYNVIFDHNSVTWATDENMSMSGHRFEGNDPAVWRAATSHRITFSNNIIAEGLAYATHFKIEHSKGTLLHDNSTDLLLVNNLYAHDYERNPLMKGGVLVMVNNLIFDPGQRIVHYNLMAEEWGDHPWQIGELAAVGNVARGGQSTVPHIAFLEIGGYGASAIFRQGQHRRRPDRQSAADVRALHDGAGKNHHVESAAAMARRVDADAVQRRPAVRASQRRCAPLGSRL